MDLYAKSEQGKMGSETIVEAIRTAKNDSSIKAVILRVNSPGGSALASEEIWREVELTNKVKPVIVSMGDLAASGGYYVATPATRIFASPSTITGSIGVFGMIPYTFTVTSHIIVTFILAIFIFVGLDAKK